MSKKFGKRRAAITAVGVKNGSVMCNAEDKDVPNREYQALLTRSSFAETSVPPIGTEVIIEKLGGEELITHIISSPGENGFSTTEVKKGVRNDCSSFSLSFGERNGAEGTEKISVEYREGGYVVDLDVDGDVTINAGGNVTITEGGTAKKVLTEDAVFEYEDTDDTGTTTTKTTSTVSNGEKSEVEIE